jgi:hypothetical protein
MTDRATMIAPSGPPASLTAATLARSGSVQIEAYVTRGCGDPSRLDPQSMILKSRGNAQCDHALTIDRLSRRPATCDAMCYEGDRNSHR